ncbi:MAG: c-type cytochrome, partial [Bacteroidia bacterium]
MKTKSALGIMATALAAFIFLDSCKTTHPVKDVSTSHVNASPARHEKGKKIANISCAPCHLDNASNTLAGAQMLDLPPLLGKVYASSLTKHPDNEITKYTDGQLRYLLRTGIKKDGKMAAFMQKPNMSDEDMDALIAFLRSDDPMLQPVTANA